jgi:hypothetical protein
MARGGGGGERDYLLLADADIASGAGAVEELVRAAVTDDRALLSQMALLRADTGWERWIVPAFVYFFARSTRSGGSDGPGHGLPRPATVHAGAP